MERGSPQGGQKMPLWGQGVNFQWAHLELREKENEGNQTPFLPPLSHGLLQGAVSLSSMSGDITHGPVERAVSLHSLS